MRIAGLVFSLASILQCNKASPPTQQTTSKQTATENTRTDDDVREMEQMKRDLKALQQSRTSYASFKNFYWNPWEARPEK